ncbi:unnamed protein product [Rhodiola kirilowii]
MSRKSETAESLRISAAASGSWIRAVLISAAWIWFKSRIVRHREISGKSVDGWVGDFVGLAIAKFIEILCCRLQSLRVELETDYVAEDRSISRSEQSPDATYH